MPGPSGREKGIRQGTANVRVGVTVDGFTGVNKDVDPGAIEDTQLQEGLNIRIPQKEIKERGGQEKLNDTSLNTCIVTIFDTEIVWPRDDVGKAFLVFSNHCGGADPRLGSWNIKDGFDNVDGLSSPYTNVIADTAAPSLQQNLIRDNTGRSLEDIAWPQPVVSSVLIDGVIYASSSTAGGTIYKVDQNGTITSFATSVGGSGLLCAYDGTLLICGGTFFKSINLSTGAVSADAGIPGGLTQPIVPYNYAVYRGMLWISAKDGAGSGDRGVVLQWTGSSLTLAHTIAHASTTLFAYGIIAHAGSLYVSWRKAGGSVSVAGLAKYNGSSWSDAWCAINGFGEQSNINLEGLAIASAGGYLWMLGGRDTSLDTKYLIRSGSGATGTWEVVISIGTGGLAKSDTDLLVIR